MGGLVTASRLGVSLRIVEACSDSVAAPGVDTDTWRIRKERYIAHLTSTKDDDVFLVSACDKLHNLRTIRENYAEHGQELWNRFTTKSAADQLWYYASLLDVFRERVPAALTAQLTHAVRELAKIAIGGDHFTGRTPRQSPSV